MRGTEWPSLTSAVAAVCAALLLASVAGCGDQAIPPAEPVSEDQSTVDPWAPLRSAGALEAEPPRPIADLGDSADVVALGQFTDTREVRTVGYGQAAAYVLPVSFVPSSVLKGDAPAPIMVEFLLFVGGPDGVNAGVKAYREALLGTEMLLLLRAKRGEGEQGLYRVVNSYGLWVETDRHDLDAPLAEKDPWTRDEFQETLSKANGSLSRLAALATSGIGTAG